MAQALADLGSRTVEDLLARDRAPAVLLGRSTNHRRYLLVAHLTSAKMATTRRLIRPRDVSSMPACSSKHSRWNTRCGRRVRRRRHPSERMGRVRLTGLATCGRMCALVFRGVRLPDNLENCYHYATCRTIWKSPYLAGRRRHAIPTRSNRSK